MRNIKFLIFILNFVIVVFLNLQVKLNAQNIDKLYEKIDLFSEVLEKIQNEY